MSVLTEARSCADLPPTTSACHTHFQQLCKQPRCSCRRIRFLEGYTFRRRLKPHKPAWHPSSQAFSQLQSALQDSTLQGTTRWAAVPWSSDSAIASAFRGTPFAPSTAWASRTANSAHNNVGSQFCKQDAPCSAIASRAGGPSVPFASLAVVSSGDLRTGAGAERRGCCDGAGRSAPQLSQQQQQSALAPRAGAQSRQQDDDDRIQLRSLNGTWIKVCTVTTGFDFDLAYFLFEGSPIPR